MSVQIDNMSEVDGLLLGGVWIDVDLGTLRRTNASRSSGVGGIELYWLSGGRMYVANAGEVHAVRSMIPAEPEVPEPEEEEVDQPVPPPLERVVEEEEPEVAGPDPNSMMATLKRAREARSGEDSEKVSEKESEKESEKDPGEQE